ncbi:hypothetical protein AVEN_152401-1 [Araneus ventricosus]|uniref:Tc1-like transposase DDE domain-containing protein n=1 Tax=Araneus ventricosus TaxID=182803 RepID=A0A4Y2DEL8_ARAVE|nr:hypothetical protein AVEN_152401-1 [Araneus ventricosus]
MAFLKKVMLGLIEHAFVDNWFQEHEGSFTPLIWPLESPDVNTVENLWDVLERALRNDTNLLSSIEDLSDKLMLLWTNGSGGLVVKSQLRAGGFQVRNLIQPKISCAYRPVVP